MAIEFWGLLSVSSLVKGFEVSYCLEFLKAGDAKIGGAVKNKTFAIGAVAALMLYILFALVEKQSFATVCAMDLISACVLVSLIDIKYKQIPNIVTLLLTVTQLLMLTYGTGLKSMENILPGGMVFAVAFAVSWLSKGQMGMGDVKLLAAICVSIGLAGVVWTIMAALALSLFVGLYLLIFKKKSVRTELPFAPFITLSLMLNLLANLF
jgi:prepilin signal peptidase PulO-like enzyme (type II secretory pathway)